MKLRSGNSALAETSSTPTALRPVSTGVAKAKKKSTAITSKTRRRSSPASSVKKKSAKSFKVSTRAKPTAAVQKKLAGKHATKINRAKNSRPANQTARKAADKPAVTPAMDPANNSAVGTAATRNRNKIKPEKRECIVCANPKYLGRNDANFPKFPSCDHDPLACTDCIVKHALIRLKARRIAPTHGRGPPNFWSAVTCPQCNGTLTEEEVRSALSRVEIKPLVEMVTLNSLHNDKRWVWCISQTCSSGQLHTKSRKKDTEAARMFTCVRCGVKSCIMHRDVWHNGLTCAQYDDRNPKSESLKSSEERIRNMTKKCPTAGCGWRIQKDGGCSSMYCPQCGQYFAWDHVRYDKNATPEPEFGNW